MKYKVLFFLVGFILFYACHTGNKEYVAIVKTDSQQIDRILDTLFSNQWSVNKRQDWKEKRICTLYFYNKRDTIEVEISYMLKEIKKSNLSQLKDNLYGIYIYDKMPILIFGEYASILFEKAAKKEILSFLKEEYALSDNEYVPSNFDPDMFVYYIVNGQIHLKYHKYF